MTEKHLKGNTKIAGWDDWRGSEREMRSLIKRGAAVFLYVPVIPLFLRVLMFYSGETLLQMKLIKSGPAFPLAISWGEEGSGGGGRIQTLVSPGFESANLKCSARW